MKYKIEIEEILNRTIEVDADNAKEARRIARDKYCAEEIVLNAEDLLGVSIRCIDNESLDSSDKKSQYEGEG